MFMGSKIEWVRRKKTKANSIEAPSSASIRNTDLQSVRTAELYSAEFVHTADRMSADRTGRSPVFQAAPFNFLTFHPFTAW
jgi:hypothetical protein